MKQLKFSGSGGGGGSGEFKQRPDNLRSEDSLEALLGLCAGPIKGPVRGLKSIRINGTPVENETGDLNFQDFTVVFADGDPGKFPQVAQLRLGSAAAPLPVNLGLTNSSTSTPGPWVVKTLNTTGADFIDLRFVVNQLYRQSESGVFDETANIELQMKPVGSTTWINPNLGTPSGTYNEQGLSVYDNLRFLIPQEYYSGGGTWLPETNSGYLRISGKTTSPFIYELRVNVPNGGAYTGIGWDIRVRLIEVDTVDDDPNFTKRNVQWESVSAVFSDKLGENEGWRALAWMQIYGKASNQLTGAPEVDGEYDTKIVQVPPSSVFDPATRAYTGGTWDGSFVKAFTTDPAWIINDALSDSISGLSVIAAGARLNKWDALEASKWFSELVPDGAGGTHPRYSMNIAVDQVHKGDEFIRYLAGAVGGHAWDSGNGEWRLKVDRPENPVDIFTLENIVGDFVYSHTDVDTRYNDIKMTFLNAEMDYAQDFVQVYDNDAIVQYGLKPTSIVAVGCTHRQEALRRAKLRLRSAINETRMVSFTTNRRGKLLQPFNTILVADKDLGNSTTGRIVSISGDRKTVTLRDTVRLEAGVAYSLRFAYHNPNYAPDTAAQPASADWTLPTLTTTRVVTNSAGERGDVKVVKLSTALPSEVAEYLTVALEATGLPTVPKAYRVLDLTPQDDGETVIISALEIDTGKWSASDNVSPSDSILMSPDPEAPSPVMPAGGNIMSLTGTELAFNWGRPSSAFIQGFMVRYRVNGGPMQILDSLTTELTATLQRPPEGEYYAEVLTIDRRGGMSRPLASTFAVPFFEVNAEHIVYEDGQTAEELKPADPGATNGAPPGSPFGTGVVEDVLQNITDLFTVYGDTVAAAAAATAAETAQGLAEDALEAATQERIASQLAASNADDSAMAAAGSASAALTHKDDAEEYAQAASVSEVSARLTVATSLPFDFQGDGKFWFGGHNAFVGSPASRTPISTDTTFSFADVSGVGRVINVTTGSNPFIDVSSIGVVRLKGGRSYRLSARFRATSAVDAPSAQLHAIGLTSAYAYNGRSISVTASPLTSGVWTDLTLELPASTIATWLADANASIYVRPTLRLGGVNDTYQAVLIRIEDITESVAANSSAEAAASHASTAGVKSTEAGTFAGAAEDWAVSAETSFDNLVKAIRSGPILPYNFVDGVREWSHERTGSPEAVASANVHGAVIDDDPDFGYAFRAIGLNVTGENVTTRGVVPVTPGRIYEVKTRFKVEASDGSAQFNIIFQPMNAAYGAVGSVFTSSVLTVTTLNQVVEITAMVSTTAASGVLTLPAGTVYFRSGLRLNSDETGMVARIGEIRVTDVTERQQGATHAANALASRNAAAISESNAAGSESAASDYASVLAEAVDDAQGFAQASSDSADIATAKAGEAGTSASAASSSEVSAKLVAASLLPSDFLNDGKFWAKFVSGSPESAAPITPDGVYSFTSVAGVGKVLQVVAGAANRDVAPIGAVLLQPGRRYRLRARFRRLTNNASPQVVLAIAQLDSSFNWQASASSTAVNLTTSNWTEGEVTLSADAAIATGGVYVRPVVNLDDGDSYQVHWARFVDITETYAAEQHAQASATSAASAEAFSDAAGDHAAASSLSRIAAETAEANSESAASLSNDYKVASENAAAAAYASQVLAASVGRNTPVRNPVYSAWSNPANPPEYYTLWGMDFGSTLTRIAGDNGGYAARFVAVANQNAGLQQHASENPGFGLGTLAPGYYVLECEVKLEAGALTGSGVYLEVRNSSNVAIEGDGIDLALHPDHTGVAPGAGVVGRVYRYSRLVQVTSLTASRAAWYSMANWDGFVTRPAKTIVFRSASFRAATAEEIATGTVLPSVAASVVTQAGAIAEVSGRVASYWGLKLDAGGNVVAIEAMAEGGGVPVSKIKFSADKAEFTGDVVVVGTLTASRLKANEGVDYASLVPAQFNMFQSAQASGPWTISAMPPNGTGEVLSGPALPELTFTSSGQDLFLVEITATAHCPTSSTTLKLGVQHGGGMAAHDVNVQAVAITVTMSSREIITPAAGSVTFSPVLQFTGWAGIVSNITMKVRKIFGKA